MRRAGESSSVVDIQSYWEVSSSGEMLSVADDTTSSIPFIEFENLENLMIDEQAYQDVLHLSMPDQSEISDYCTPHRTGCPAKGQYFIHHKMNKAFANIMYDVIAAPGQHSIQSYNS